MKDAYYFSHDSNARNDQRIIKLRRKYGAEGVGIYWMIIEILREQEEYRLGLDDDTIENIAYDLRVDQEKLEDIILHFNLFERDIGVEEFGYFYSSSLKRRIERADEIRQKRSYAGQMSGKARQVINTSLTDDKQVLNIKGKEIKVNKIKERYLVFKKQVFEFSNQYNHLLLGEFLEYWTEPNKGNTKMKYEMQKTWDLSRRLKRWADNDFGSNKNNGLSEFKLDSTGNAHIAYCDKCHKSDFYRKEELRQDSRCCKSKLLPEKPSAVR